MDYFKALLKKKSVLVIIGVVVIGAGYFGYKTYKAKTAKATYVTSPVEKGTLTVSVSGTGQVSSSDQIDLKPNNSGTVLSVSAKQGQTVSEGTVIAQIDPKDAAISVRDAQNNLEAAQIAMEKLTTPTNSSLLSSQDALAAAQQSESSAEDALKKSYDDGYTSLSDTYIDLPSILSGVETILGHEYLSDNMIREQFGNPGRTYRTNADAATYPADTQLQSSLKLFRASSRQSDQATVDSLLSDTYTTTKTIADAVKTLKLLVDYVQANGNSQSGISADEATLTSYTNQVNSHLQALSNSQTTIQSAKNSIDSAQRNVNEKNQALTDTTSADPLDIKSQQLKVNMAQDALNDAEQKLGDYTIRSPISGVIAALNIQKGDQATSATVAASIITQEQIAEITMNEVDVSKVKVGQKSTLTFDALPDLSITGEVAEIDSIGTVTQGVVSYKVKLAFDTQNDQIKPGMSVSADIITDVKQDVLMVPSSAIKTAGGSSTVDVLVNGQPVTKNITTGASNDTNTEVSGDINEGDPVITQTILPNAKSTNTNTARAGATGLQGLTGGGARGGFGGGAAAGGAARGGGG